jgi:malate permease and related proteins
MAAALLLIFGMLALGQLCARLQAVPEGTAEALHRVVLLICLPALVLVQLRHLSFDRQTLLLALLPWAWVIVSVGIVLLTARLAGWSREVRGCLLLTVPLGNTAFLGYPMIEGLLGHAALRHAVVYDQLGSFLILSTYAVSVAGVYRAGERPALGALVRRVLTYPAFVALVVGLLPIPWPEPVLVVLQRVADCLVPLVLFAIGLQLKLRLPTGQGAPLAFALVTKMVGGAALALLACWLFAAPVAVRDVAILQAAMPVMVTAAALAIEAKLAPELAAAQAGLGVLLALAWLPALAGWLTSH